MIRDSDSKFEKWRKAKYEPHRTLRKAGGHGENIHRRDAETAEKTAWAKAHFKSECFSAGLESSSPLLKQGAPTKKRGGSRGIGDGFNAAEPEDVGGDAEDENRGRRRERPRERVRAVGDVAGDDRCDDRRELIARSS